MPSKRNLIPLLIKGGWATSVGPQSADISHLLTAENVYYELDGGVRKIPGAAKLNSTAITEASVAQTVMALFDFWKSGTAWAPVQKRMAYAGTKIYKEDLDGTWDSLKTGLESGKQASFTQMNDLAIWSSVSTVDVPQSWNQTDATTSNLAGSPPNFSFCVPHRGRMWAAGVASNPSRVYYSALDTAIDWTGAGSGSIDIDLNDGDVITGLASHKQRLWVFKGPNRGSIHYITGSSPTGSDAFARLPFSTGLPCVAHQTIVSYMNDLAFLSARGIHSLSATEQYGDMKEGFLSFQIQSVFLENLDLSSLAFAQGVNHRGRGLMLWTVRQSGQSNNNWVFVYDYRFQPGRLSLLTAYGAASLAIILHNSQPRLFSGGYDGFVLRHDESNRNMANASYTAKIATPYIHFGNPDLMKQTAWWRLGIQPQGSSSLTIQYQHDDGAIQSTSVAQSSGAALDNFVLDTDILGGGAYLQRYVEMPGAYRVQQVTISQGGLNEDMEVHEMAAQLEGSGLSEV